MKNIFVVEGGQEASASVLVGCCLGNTHSGETYRKVPLALFISVYKIKTPYVFFSMLHCF